MYVVIPHVPAESPSDPAPVHPAPDVAVAHPSEVLDPARAGVATASAAKRAAPAAARVRRREDVFMGRPIAMGEAEQETARRASVPPARAKAKAWRAIAPLRPEDACLCAKQACLCAKRACLERKQACLERKRACFERTRGCFERKRGCSERKQACWAP